MTLQEAFRIFRERLDLVEQISLTAFSGTPKMTNEQTFGLLREAVVEALSDPRLLALANATLEGSAVVVDMRDVEDGEGAE